MAKMTDLENDLHKQITDKLARWAKDSVELHEMVDLTTGPESVLYALLRVSVGLLVKMGIEREAFIDLMTAGYDSLKADKEKYDAANR